MENEAEKAVELEGEAKELRAACEATFDAELEDEALLEIGADVGGTGGRDVELEGEEKAMVELDTDFREDLEVNVEATVEVESKVGAAGRGFVGGETKSEVYHSPRLSINRGRREAVPPTARHLYCGTDGRKGQKNGLM